MSFLAHEHFEKIVTDCKGLFKVARFIFKPEKQKGSWIGHGKSLHSHYDNINAAALIYSGEEWEGVTEGQHSFQLAQNRSSTSVTPQRKWCVINTTTWKHQFNYSPSSAFLTLNCSRLCVWLGVTDLFVNLVCRCADPNPGSWPWFMEKSKKA